MDKIAERIRELIDNLGLTNSEFAKQTNLNPATVSHILGGRNKASLQVIENIKHVFTNVNIDYLITGEGDLFNDVTNVNTPGDAFNTSLFPMEGVRMASVGAMPPPVEDTNPAPVAVSQQKQEESSTQSNTEPPSPGGDLHERNENSSLAGKEIERIVFFYSDGSFKSYKP